MVEYIRDNYSNLEKRTALANAAKGLEDLHALLANNPQENMGIVYEVMQVKEKLGRELLKLHNYSNGTIKGHQTRKITQQQALIKENQEVIAQQQALLEEKDSQIKYLLPPAPEDYAMINYHGFSFNYMYDRYEREAHRSKGYNEWRYLFPYSEVPPKKYWTGVDWNAPIKMYIRFICKEKFDTDNLIKSVVDTIITECYGENDNIVKRYDAATIRHCDSFREGKIFFYIRNLTSQELEETRKARNTGNTPDTLNTTSTIYTTSTRNTGVVTTLGRRIGSI
jgi:Holliday junction resolvase RusA-like endonuclease